MIAFSSVSKQYGGQILFVDASFQINPGEKVGLVGPNGAGKTTVFRLIAGEEQPDDGAIERPRKLSLGYFRQSVGELAGRSILAETCAGAGEVAELGAELARLSTRLEAAGDDLDDVVARFGEVQARYQDLGGYELEARAQAILAGLGFPEDTVGRDVGTLSGGWKMRVALAQILLARPDVLLLDEPTNYLDLESILWLEAFLRDFPGTVVMTCHDREIMNRVVGKIVEIDGGALRSYTGNYDFYEKMRVEEAQRREAEYARYHTVIHLAVPSAGGGYNLHNPTRKETPEEARRVDEGITRAWAGHPRVCDVSNETDFVHKLERAMLLIQAARSAVFSAQRRTDPISQWVQRLHQRSGWQVATVALACGGAPPGELQGAVCVLRDPAALAGALDGA